MEIPIKTTNEKEFKEVMNFLKKEKIEILRLEIMEIEYSDDFKVMEKEVKKYRAGILQTYKSHKRNSKQKISDFNKDSNTLAKAIKENKIQLLNSSKVRDIVSMKRAAKTMDKIRNSYVKDKDWNSVDIIRKFREMK